MEVSEANKLQVNMTVGQIRQILKIKQTINFLDKMCDF